MGCLKLTYREELPTLKVVKGFSFSIEKSCAGLYRYGFGGQEKDDEVNGVTGSSYTAEFWQYDSRLGRRWNVDPITYPWQSSYAAFNNNPIYFTDPLGLFGTRGKAKEFKKKHNKRGYVKRNKSGEFIFTERKTKTKYGFGAAIPNFDFAVVEKGLTKKEQGQMSKLFTAVDDYLRRNGVQIYGSATNSSESLARKGKKSDPFNRSIDMAEVEDLLGLIKSRIGKMTPSVRAAAKAKFETDYKSFDGRNTKLFGRIATMIKEGDVKNRVLSTQKQANKSSVPSTKIIQSQYTVYTQEWDSNYFSPDGSVHLSLRNVPYFRAYDSSVFPNFEGDTLFLPKQ